MSDRSDFDKAVMWVTIFLIIYALYEWLFKPKKSTPNTDPEIWQLEAEIKELEASIQRQRQEIIDLYGVDPDEIDDE